MYTESLILRVAPRLLNSLGAIIINFGPCACCVIMRVYSSVIYNKQKPEGSRLGYHHGWRHWRRISPAGSCTALGGKSQKSHSGPENLLDSTHDIIFFHVLFKTLRINHNEVNVLFCTCFKLYGRGDGTRLILTARPRLQSWLTVFSYLSLTVAFLYCVCWVCVCLCV